MTDAFFHPDADRYVPTLLCQGPWDPGSAHGGPPAALLAREIERHEPDPDLFVTRISLELLRPIPLAPMRVTTRTIRPGKRVQLVEVVLSVDDVECVRGVGLRVRRPPSALDVDASRANDGFPPPGALAPMQDRAEIEESVRAGLISAINLGLEMRPARGSWLEPGPAACWFRMLAPLVAGEETTPLARAMVAADFANGISSELSFDDHIFINPDLTVHLWRLPAGEWVALDAVTNLAPGAGAISTGVLRDESGTLGRSTQSLYVAER